MGMAIISGRRLAADAPFFSPRPSFGIILRRSMAEGRRIPSAPFVLGSSANSRLASSPVSRCDPSPSGWRGVPLQSSSGGFRLPFCIEKTFSITWTVCPKRKAAPSRPPDRDEAWRQGLRIFRIPRQWASKTTSRARFRLPAKTASGRR